MSALNNLKVFSTSPHTCSYLSDKKATTLFVDPDASIDDNIYTELNDLGFRRSGKHFYLPYCKECQACIATRIPVALFEPNRSQKRILKRNQDLSLSITNAAYTEEHYSLYANYIQQRHPDGDMFPPSKEQFMQFIGEPTNFSEFLEFRLDGKLIAVSVVDKVDNSYSAIYTYFDTEMDQRSLGTLAILKQLEIAMERKYPYVYLGYWIKDCKKMSYKINFRPIEILINRRWQLLN